MANIDRKASGQRGKGRRIQPYAWLGAGAVTLGLGAAMAGGTAIAHADDSSSAGSSGVLAQPELQLGACQSGGHALHFERQPGVSGQEVDEEFRVRHDGLRGHRGEQYRQH